MKIKIFEVYCHVFADDNFYQKHYDLFSQTDWEEVTDDEFDTLFHWANTKNNVYEAKFHTLIIKEKDVNIPTTIRKYLELIEKEKLKKEEEGKLRKEKYDKANQIAIKKKEQKEKKLLEELKTKYER